MQGRHFDLGQSKVNPDSIIGSLMGSQQPFPVAEYNFDVSLIPENSMEHIPCNVSLVEANALRCNLLVSTWNKYKERKITIKVCFVIATFPKPFDFNDPQCVP